MGGSLLMAFDLGGGSGRCMLVDPEAGVVRVASRSWTHPVAPNTAGLGYDLDLEDIWKKMGDASRQVLRESGAAPGEVAGVAACSMRNTTVLMDAAGGVLFAAPNQDARALGNAHALAGERGMEVYEKGGHWPSPLFTGTRLLWLAENSPALLERAARVASLSDWMGWRLCGELRAERSQAGETLLFDQRRRDWDRGLISSLGLDGDLFPGTVDAGERIGSLTREAADHLGLAPGTPVAAGGADTQSGLLGMGCVEEVGVGINAGTSMPVQQVTASYVTDGEGRLWSGQHVVPGLYVVESNGLITGTVLEWMARVIYPDSPHPVAALCADAAASEPGACGVYSTLGARVFDARVTSVLLGNITMSHMVTTDTSTVRSHLSRALLEGIAYSARANLEQVLAVTGAEPAAIAVGGGMAKSALWTAILAEVTGRKVAVPGVHEVASLGAAVCAGVGAGIFRGLREGSRALARPGREHVPGADSERYRGLYAGWREAVELRAPCDSHMANLMAVAMLGRSPAAEAPASFRPRIMVTASMDEAALEELRAMGEVTYRPWREERMVYDGGERLAEALRGHQVFITEMDIVDFEALRALPELKMVICCRVNAVNVDLEAATAYGVPVANTPGRNADAVADLVVAYMIMLARKLPQASSFLKHGKVSEGDMARMGEAYLAYQGKELWRKTVGLVGLGSVGARVARRLLPFGARVLFHDPAVGAEEGALVGAEKVSFEELLERSDFVSLHAPAVKATEGMMDARAFSRMKEGAFFINTARASLVDHHALAEALEAGRLAGAALDVFPVEPPGSDDRLVRREEVIATPHIGGNTVETGAHQGQMAAQQLRDLLRGRAPAHILNPEALEGFDWTAPRREPAPEVQERLAANPRPSMTS
ncbi:MAG: NAD(P)-dependent oxidoreductase [Actinomycetota bacterium]|nr:NAD(P)-dependent oxidoreductase [Actinomycetota bacterium]